MDIFPDSVCTCSTSEIVAKSVVLDSSSGKEGTLDRGLLLLEDVILGIALCTRGTRTFALYTRADMIRVDCIFGGADNVRCRTLGFKAGSFDSRGKCRNLNQYTITINHSAICIAFCHFPCKMYCWTSASAKVL